MKKILLFVLLFTASSVVSYSQNRRLKGPAAKNYKPWQNNKLKQHKAYKISSSRSRIRPKQKKIKTIAFSTRARKRITGPKAKNQKPWLAKRKRQSKVREEMPKQRKKMLAEER